MLYLRDEAEALSLPITAKMANRMGGALLNTATEPIPLEMELDELDSRFEDEIEDRKLFLIKPELFGFRHRP